MCMGVMFRVFAVCRTGPVRAFFDPWSPGSRTSSVLARGCRARKRVDRKSRSALEMRHPPLLDSRRSTGRASCGSRPDSEDIDPNDAVQRPRRNAPLPCYKSRRDRTDRGQLTTLS